MEDFFYDLRHLDSGDKWILGSMGIGDRAV